MDHIEMVSVFDEATRDYEAEQHHASLSAAVEEAKSVWPFLAMALSEEEYATRVALSHERLTTIAQRHGVSYEDLTAPLARGFAIALEARLPGGDVTHGVECGNCGHSNPGHTDGGPCQCGCTSFQGKQRTAAKEASAGCPNCGSSNITYTVKPGASGSGPGGSWRMGDHGGQNVIECKDCGKTSPHSKTAAVEEDDRKMPPGSVQVHHRPDKSGRWDVRQVWDPMTAYIIHQGYDHDAAVQAATNAVDKARSEGYGEAKHYDHLGQRVSNMHGIDKASSRDPYALIRQALMDGQDPLEWIAQQNPPGGPQNALVPSGHDSTQQMMGTNPVALTQAMESEGGTGAPEQPGGHSDTQRVSSARTAADVPTAEYGTPEYEQGMRDWYKQRENVTYTDGSPVQHGDRIRYHQAPGGLMPHGDWEYGTAVSQPHDRYEGVSEMTMLNDATGRHHNLYGHVIERAPGGKTSSLSEPPPFA